MEVQRKLPLEALNNQLIMPLYYFSYPLFPLDEKILSWVESDSTLKVISKAKKSGRDGFEEIFGMKEWTADFLTYAEDARIPVWVKIVMREVGSLGICRAKQQFMRSNF